MHDLIKRRRRFGTLVAVLFLTVVASGRAEWLYGETEHFEVFTSAGKAETLEVLGDLEVYHDVIMQVFGGRRMVNQRTRIVLFDRQRDMEPYVGEDEMAEYNMFTNVRGVSQADGALIAMSGESRWKHSRRSVQKVYAYTLLSSIGMSQPPWFGAGLSKVFASFEIGRNEMMLGRASADEVYVLQRREQMPWSELLHMQPSLWQRLSAIGAPVHDAQAWALLHYCFLSPERAQTWRAGILQMALDAQMGERDYAALVQRHLGVSMEELTEEMKAYTRKTDFPAADLPLPEGGVKSKLRLKKADPVGVEDALWEVKARFKKDDATVAELAVARAETSRLRLRELQGSLALVLGDVESAEAHWDQAREAGSQNAFVVRFRAEREIRRRLAQGAIEQQFSPAEAEPLRAELERALELDPGDYFSVQWLAWLEALAEKPSIANVNRVQRAVGEMARPHLTYLAIARLQSRLGDAATARNLVNSLQAWPNWEWAPAVRAVAAALPAEAE